jgi:hypothetical protein
MAGPKRSSSNTPQAYNQMVSIAGQNQANTNNLLERQQRAKEARVGYSPGAKYGISLEAAESIIAQRDKEKIQANLDAKAKEMGFANEQDRVSQVSRIIDSFGKVKKGKLPAALAGSKAGYMGNTPGIMTKAGG